MATTRLRSHFTWKMIICLAQNDMLPQSFMNKVLGSPWGSLLYARRVVKGRWPKGEPTIMKDPYDSVVYADDVIKGRWPEAEPTIATEPYSAVDYALFVIKGPWPEGEPAIRSEMYCSNVYDQFLRRAYYKTEPGDPFEELDRGGPL